MKTSVVSLAFATILISCSKKDDFAPKFEPDTSLDPTNELVGTTWQRTLNPELFNYLEFKSSKELIFSSRYQGVPSERISWLYTLNDKKIVYTVDRFNYTGTISGDTLRMGGTADFLIFVKIK